ncbi:MAG: four helix bundle protein [Bacteroidales bacterium]|nr:four helix bundle protein [Bacteroidales bacterium]
MHNFRNLDIWKNGIKLVKEIYQLSVLLHDEEKFGLTSQIRRVAVSVPSNIAEGCSCSSEIEYKRFLEIAERSLFEIETLLIIITELTMIAEDRVNPIMEKVHTEQRMINNLISKIKANI